MQAPALPLRGGGGVTAVSLPALDVSTHQEAPQASHWGLSRSLARWLSSVSTLHAPQRDGVRVPAL